MSILSSKSSLMLAVLALAVSACDSQTSITPPVYLDPEGESEPKALSCSLPSDQIYVELVKDAIPALVNPKLTNARTATYPNDDDRVLGLRVGSLTVAIPHKLLGYHEIVNLDFTDPPLAVTYCPLTGSGIAFDRHDVSGAEFGVSGLLYKNNLIMYDRNSVESLWPQMDRRARCGPADGIRLYTYPVLDITWKGWRALHPATQVVSQSTGYTRDYHSNPYQGYDEPDNGALLYGMPVDGRRPPKERVLGIPSGDDGIAFPFGALDDGASVRIVYDEAGSFAVFWDGERQTAMAYRLNPGQQFEARDGAFQDVETLSVWRVDGCAVEGALRGRCLQPVRDAYVAFWFAWAAFNPATELWTGER